SCYGILDGMHDYEVAIEMIASGQSQLAKMVTHRYSLDDIQKGFETAYDKTTGSIKVQIIQ
ncbi:MAG: Zn-dependent alcohol dehydrogenase, partial [Chloroflexi bacterium]|nr:Zn-dependent alcohol dehydrogenase [Chloroflexota bacterium]